MLLLKFFGLIFNRSLYDGPSFAGILLTTSITTSTALSGVFSALFLPPVPSAPIMALTFKNSLVGNYPGVRVRGHLRVRVALDDRGPIRVTRLLALAAGVVAAVFISGAPPIAGS